MMDREYLISVFHDQLVLTLGNLQELGMRFQLLLVWGHRYEHDVNLVWVIALAERQKI